MIIELLPRYQSDASALDRLYITGASNQLVPLTAVTDNAALTYLGSLVPGLSQEFKIALVSGAVTGGGLTLIANAPNPAGAAVLKGSFSQQAIQPVALLLAATPPTLVAIAAFRLF